MEELSNLDLDLTGVDISRPLLPDQQLLCTTGNVRVVVDGEKGTRSLVVPLTLEQPGKDTKGNTINVGYGVTDSMLLTPTGGLTQQMINEKVARFQCAVLKLDKPGPVGDLGQYAGRKVLVTFGLRNDKQDPSVQYQAIRRYTAVKD